MKVVLKVCWNCFIIQFINSFKLIISIIREGTYIYYILLYIICQYMYIYKSLFAVLVVFIYGVEI
jgi:hypothetical protein